MTTLRIGCILVLAACFLMVPCCADSEAHLAQRRILQHINTRPEDVTRDVAVLADKHEDGLLIEILERVDDPDVRHPVSDYFKRKDGGDIALFQKHAEQIRKEQGTFFVADIYICRGMSRGLILLADEFHRLEAEAPEDINSLKILSFLRSYLIDLTQVRFETAQSYDNWLSLHAKVIRIDVGRGHGLDQPHVRLSGQ